MKKILQVLGVLFIGLILIAGYGFYKSSKESEVYKPLAGLTAEKFIQCFYDRPWNECKEFVSDEFLEKTSDEQVSQLKNQILNIHGKRVKVTNFDDSSLNWTTKSSIKKGRITLVSFNEHAQYEKKEDVVEKYSVTIDEDHNVKVVGFNIGL